MTDVVENAPPRASNGMAAARRGRLRLGPIEASTSSEVVVVEVELERADARLTLGDLRRAADASDEAGGEAAHRLWAALALAAASVDAPVLERYARERVAECLRRRHSPATEAHFRQSRVRHDYLAIATDRSSGMSATAVAQRHGCSLATVRRAVEFADQRDELLRRHPDATRRCRGGADPALMAAELGIDANVLRWAAGVEGDRRRAA